MMVTGAKTLSWRVPGKIRSQWLLFKEVGSTSGAEGKVVQQVSNGGNVCSRAGRPDPAAVDKALRTGQMLRHLLCK